MPEVYVKIKWPNQQSDTVYSPSSVIKNYFKPGASLTVEQFHLQVREALFNASQRVKERFGFECSSAMGELQRLEFMINAIEDKNGLIEILSVQE